MLILSTAIIKFRWVQLGMSGMNEYPWMVCVPNCLPKFGMVYNVISKILWNQFGTACNYFHETIGQQDYYKKLQISPFQL